MDDSRVNNIYETYAKKGYQAWRQDLVRSVHDEDSQTDFPTFPSADLQRHIQGNANETAIRGALAFRDYCSSTAAALSVPIDRTSILLDFGTGWGRIARAFMADVPASRIYAVEPFDYIIDARRHNPYVSFIKSEPLPPLPLRNNLASHIVSWSIFSHFNKEYFDKWLQELGRVLQPGGLCVISTLGVHFLHQLEEAREVKRSGGEIHFWLDLILQRIGDRPIEEIVDTIKSGQLFWLPSSQVARAEFAECFVTEKYIARHHAKLFEVVSYASNGELAQDCIVLKKKK
jgi:ubiquinone/menaquinone biosynthesis C-methylase UbiE